MPTTCKLTEISWYDMRKRNRAEVGIPTTYALSPLGMIILDPSPKEGIIKSIHIVIHDERTLEERAALPETED